MSPLIPFQTIIGTKYKSDKDLNLSVTSTKTVTESRSEKNSDEPQPAKNPPSFERKLSFVEFLENIKSSDIPKTPKNLDRGRKAFVDLGINRSYSTIITKRFSSLDRETRLNNIQNSQNMENMEKEDDYEKLESSQTTNQKENSKPTSKTSNFISLFRSKSPNLNLSPGTFRRFSTRKSSSFGKIDTNISKKRLSVPTKTNQHVNTHESVVPPPKPPRRRNTYKTSIFRKKSLSSQDIHRASGCERGNDLNTAQGISAIGLDLVEFFG